MRLVIDSNIMFSALIKDGQTAELIFNHELHAPSYLLSELSRYKDYIIRKTSRTEEEFGQFLTLLHRNINFHAEPEYSSMLGMARQISPDTYDVPFFALALTLSCAIWSNDKRLGTCQEIVRIRSTRELIERDIR